MFELPGGHIDFGENLTDGLTREIREKFGVDVSIGDPFAAFTYVNDIKGFHSVEVVFFGTFSDSIENISCNPEDHSGFEWFTREEVVARRGEIQVGQYADLDSDGDPKYVAILRGFDMLNAGSTHGQLNHWQNKIDTWAQRLEKPYWEPLSQYARVVEEVGEVGRLLNHLYGDKPKKQEEARQELGEEIADVLFALICIANRHDIDLDAEMEKVLAKCYDRDGERFKKRSTS